MRPDLTRTPPLAAPPSIDARLLAAVRRLAHVPTLLVALDFDGTLAPFRVDPSTSRATPEARHALERLRVLPSTTVALVSGRSLRSLIGVAHAPTGVVLVGSHGLEARLRDGSVSPAALNDAQRSALVDVGERLEALTSPDSGAWVERKPTSVSLHTRAVADPDRARALEAQAREAARGVPGVRVLGGKRVVELAVRLGDKGRALDWLRGRLDADGVFYAGDDTTDERGFMALGPGDVDVHVGGGESVAEYSVRDIDDVAALLDVLADAREGAGD